METKLVIMAGSAGSMNVMLDIVSTLGKGIVPAILIMIHRKSTLGSALLHFFAEKTSLAVKEAEEKEKIKPGTIYIAPANYHLLIESDQSFSLDASEKVHYSRPSFDVSFQSAAEVFKKNLTGILLSGANADGVEGLRFIKHYGGTTIVQNPETADVPFMPQQAILHAHPQYILNTEEIARYISKL